jgi:hypothetical protein
MDVLVDIKAVAQACKFYQNHRVTVKFRSVCDLPSAKAAALKLKETVKMKTPVKLKPTIEMGAVKPTDDGRYIYLYPTESQVGT